MLEPQGHACSAARRHRAMSTSDARGTSDYGTASERTLVGPAQDAPRSSQQRTQRDLVSPRSARCVQAPSRSRTRAQLAPSPVTTVPPGYDLPPWDPVRDCVLSQQQPASVPQVYVALACHLRTRRAGAERRRRVICVRPAAPLPPPPAHVRARRRRECALGQAARAGPFSTAVGRSGHGEPPARGWLVIPRARGENVLEATSAPDDLLTIPLSSAGERRGIKKRGAPTRSTVATLPAGPCCPVEFPRAGDPSHHALGPGRG